MYLAIYLDLSYTLVVQLAVQLARCKSIVQFVVDSLQAFDLLWFAVHCSELYNKSTTTNQSKCMEYGLNIRRPTQLARQIGLSGP